jgi:hypothetical protein
MTQYVISPGIKEFKPRFREMIWHFGGRMLETWTKFAFSIPPPAEHYFQPDSAAEFLPKFLHPPQDLAKIQRRVGPIDHLEKLGIPGIQRGYHQVGFP